MMEFSGLIQGIGRVRGSKNVEVPVSFKVQSVLEEATGEELPYKTAIRIWNKDTIHFDGFVYGPDRLSSFRIASEFVIGTLQF